MINLLLNTKSITSILLLFLMISCHRNKPNQININIIKEKDTLISLSKEVVNTINDTIAKNLFLKDSGYISKKEGFKFLKNFRTDKNYTIIDYVYRGLKENDTIGKYYRKRNTNYVCMPDLYLYRFMYIFEIDSNNTILKKEHFGPAFNLDAFHKKGEYFIFTSHYTGSAYSSNRGFIFKELKSQDSLNPVTFSVFNGACFDGMEFSFLDSKIKFNPNYLILDYNYEIGVNKLDKDIVKKRGNFKIKYKLKGSTWSISKNDSLRLEQFPI